MNILFAAVEIIQKGNLPQIDSSKTTFDKLLGIFWVILGSVAVLMLVIAGTRYVFAGGDANRLTAAKNMIVYTVIGLVLAASAGLIVKVVINMINR